MISRSFPWLLLLGIALRGVALNQPLIDAHNTRQCQTAILTKNMMVEPGLPLAARADWMGDEPGKLFLELPVYNEAVLLVHRLVPSLDMSGKLVSIAFWILACGLNHKVMRMVLSRRQVFWGDVLFVLSPLSIFFGQAFQPESLMVTLSLGIVGSFLCFQKTRSERWFAFCVALSLLAACIKANEVSHIFVLIALLALAREGWGCLRQIRYWIFLVLLALVTKTYGSFLTEVNAVSFPEWTTGNLGSMMGRWEQRLDVYFYARIGMYVALLLTTPAGLLVVLLGLWRVFRTQRQPLYLLWFFALVLFYLFWGPGTSFVHSYYNLPALPVACGLFGIGMSMLIHGMRRKWRPTKPPRLIFPRMVMGGALALFFAGSVLGSVVLFWPDQTAYAGALALRRLAAGSEDYALCYANHTRYGPGYIHYTTLFYYSGLRGWNENPGWTAEQRAKVLQKCRWVIELKFNPVHQFPWRGKTWFSNRPLHQLDTHGVSENKDFQLVEETPDYRIWSRNPLNPCNQLERNLENGPKTDTHGRKDF